MRTTSVQVESDSGKTYTITLEDGQPTWCTCPGYKFAEGQSQKRVCKHVAALLATGIGVHRNA